METGKPISFHRPGTNCAYFCDHRMALFQTTANEVLPLGFVTPRDHIRASGSVVTTARDIDGDGRLDLMVTHIEGGFSDATTTTLIYFNRDGRWNLADPNDRFVSKGILVSDLLVDLDQDNKLELVRIELKFSFVRNRRASANERD